MCRRGRSVLRRGADWSLVRERSQPLDAEVPWDWCGGRGRNLELNEHDFRGLEVGLRGDPGSLCNVGEQNGVRPWRAYGFEIGVVVVVFGRKRDANCR